MHKTARALAVALLVTVPPIHAWAQARPAPNLADASLEDLLAVRILVGSTKGDDDKFAESGGVAQLIVERDRIHFAINVAAAQRGRLKLSSKMLNLANIIRKEDR